ncbi:unnamed protein product [Ambrosiozyma monospora]|uniref:Unnamed protein product n=1 Tax=Ambrosiozyma monospora TaxID=43982 RepID=A0ACB5SZV4_AMBMO|nr:unnamed protein product [Ambrosiozyma monospora]
MLFAFEFAYNSTVHEATKAIPFFVDLGFVPDGPSFVSGMSVNRFSPAGTEFVNNLRATLSQVQDALVESQKRAEGVVNKHRSPVDYKVGDWVLIYRGALASAQSTKFNKIQSAYFGPYRLVNKLNDNAFEVDVPSHIRKHQSTTYSS